MNMQITKHIAHGVWCLICMDYTGPECVAQTSSDMLSGGAESTAGRDAKRLDDDTAAGHTGATAAEDEDAGTSTTVCRSPFGKT